jgi:hypothetical protein
MINFSTTFVQFFSVKTGHLSNNQMTQQEEKYQIKERCESDVKEYGSVQNAIKAISEELEKAESFWGKFSSDCLGHEITCSRLKIRYLTEQLNGKT